MVMDRQNRTGVEEDRGFEDFTRMHKAERECPDGDDVHADAGVLGIETTYKELLAIKTIKARTECGCRGSGIPKNAAWSCVTAFSDERDAVARNELWNGKWVDGLFGHGGTSCMLNKLALSQKPKRQSRTTEVAGRGLPKQHGRTENSGGRDRSLLARALRQAISARQDTGSTWPNKSNQQTMADECACFREMEDGRNAIIGRAKQIRKRR